VLAIQHLCLTKFITTMHWVDETTVLLPYKTFHALNGNVLLEPDKLGQSFMAVSKYFQNFCSLPLNGTIYVSVLIRFDSSMDDFFKSLCHKLSNSDHKVYSHSIQAPFISKISWLFQIHKHTNL